MKGCTEVSCSQVSDPHPVVITHIAHTMALQGSPSDPRARAKGPLHKQIYVFSIPRAALPGGIRSASSQQVNRPYGWLVSISAPDAGLSPTQPTLPLSGLNGPLCPRDKSSFPEPTCVALSKLRSGHLRR
jgi:hypothetical protein